MKQKPGRVQNAVEWAYEFRLRFRRGDRGERARRYYPIFAAFFLFILFSNWSGLVRRSARSSSSGLRPAT